MKRILTSLSLALLGAVSAAAVAQDKAVMKQLDAKAAQMKRCADIARELEKIPVPPKHAEAKNVAASKAVAKEQKIEPPSEAKAKAATVAVEREKTAAPVDSTHAQFEANVKRLDQDFMKCGNELFKDMRQVEAKVKPFMEQVKKQKLAEAEMKAVSASIGGYMKAKQDLQAAVELLSKDIQMQAYVEKTLTGHYLNQKY
jgi:signal transduction protein with GAF and PtsI domain